MADEGEPPSSPSPRRAAAPHSARASRRLSFHGWGRRRRAQESHEQGGHDGQRGRGWGCSPVAIAAPRARTPSGGTLPISSWGSGAGPSDGRSTCIRWARLPRLEDTNTESNDAPAGPRRQCPLRAGSSPRATVSAAMRPPRRLRPVPLGVAAWMRPRRRHPPHVVSLAGDAHPQHPAPRACALPSTGRNGDGTIPMAAAGEAGETRMPRRGARGGTAAGAGRGREETRDLHRLSVWSHSARPLPARCGGRPVAMVAGGSGGRTFQAATSGRWAVCDRNDWRRQQPSDSTATAPPRGSRPPCLGALVAGAWRQSNRRRCPRRACCCPPPRAWPHPTERRGVARPPLRRRVCTRGAAGGNHRRADRPSLHTLAVRRV